MDKQMPVMSGLEATRILRELGYKKPIYALTADVMKEQQEELFHGSVSLFEAGHGPDGVVTADAIARIGDVEAQAGEPCQGNVHSDRFGV